jgi:hypothetical protein
MSFAPFLTLEQENRINSQKRQIDYQYNGRLFIPPKTLQIHQNDTQSLENFYSVSRFDNATKNSTSELARTLRSMFFTQGNLDVIYGLLRANGAASYSSAELVKETMRKVFTSYEITNTESPSDQLNNLNQMVVDRILNINTGINGDKRIVKPGESTNKRAYDLFYGESQQQPLNTSIITNQIEPNKLTVAYFSKKNLDYIQQQIIDGIKNQYGQDISRQSDTQVQIVMRSIYFQFGKNNNLPLQTQLDELNKLVIAECIRIIYPNILQYQGYIRDVTNPIPTVPLPVSSNITGSNTFSLFVV